jgi:hypothetical protein
MKMQTLKAAALLVLATIAVVACEDSDVKDGGRNYLLGFRTSTDPTADYLVFEDSLNAGTISATGRGEEQDGWSYYTKAGNTFIAADYDNSIATGYRLENNTLTQVGQFAFERMDCFGEGEEGKGIAIGAPWGGGSFNCKIMVIDGASVSISKSVNTPIYTSYYGDKQMNAWPTATWLEGNKLYVSFYTLFGDTWETPSVDTAYVSVYSYPELEYQSTFKDTRTGPIGYYSSQPCVLEDESGNHFTLSCTSIAGGFTQTSSKPSGILKINRGQQSFDEDYFFNVEALGYRVMGGAYAGNGKVVARVISVDLDNTMEPWASFATMQAPIHRMAVLDLNAKTLKLVDEVPLHGGQYLTPFLVENGKVWASITTSAADSYVYQIDPNTATATKGARIEGSEIQTFFKY